MMAEQRRTRGEVGLTRPDRCKIVIRKITDGPTVLEVYDRDIVAYMTGPYTLALTVSA